MQHHARGDPIREPQAAVVFGGEGGEDARRKRVTSRRAVVVAEFSTRHRVANVFCESELYLSLFPQLQITLQQL